MYITLGPVSGFLLNKRLTFLSSPLKEEKFPLDSFAENGQLELLKSFLKGKDLKHPYFEELMSSALHHPHVVKYLLDKGVKELGTKFTKMSRLGLVFLNGLEDKLNPVGLDLILSFLEKEGIEKNLLPFLRDSLQEKMDYLAALGVYHDNVPLLKHILSLEVEGKRGSIPLLVLENALESNNLEVAKFLFTLDLDFEDGSLLGSVLLSRNLELFNLLIGRRKFTSPREKFRFFVWTDNLKKLRRLDLEGWVKAPFGKMPFSFSTVKYLISSGISPKFFIPFFKDRKEEYIGIDSDEDVTDHKESMDIYSFSKLADIDKLKAAQRFRRILYSKEMLQSM